MVFAVKGVLPTAPPGQPQRASVCSIRQLHHRAADPTRGQMMPFTLSYLSSVST